MTTQQELQRAREWAPGARAGRSGFQPDRGPANVVRERLAEAARTAIAQQAAGSAMGPAMAGLH